MTKLHPTEGNLRQRGSSDGSVGGDSDYTENPVQEVKIFTPASAQPKHSGKSKLIAGFVCGVVLTILCIGAFHVGLNSAAVAEDESDSGMQSRYKALSTYVMPKTSYLSRLNSHFRSSAFQPTCSADQKPVAYDDDDPCKNAGCLWQCWRNCTPSEFDDMKRNMPNVVTWANDNPFDPSQGSYPEGDPCEKAGCLWQCWRNCRPGTPDFNNLTRLEWARAEMMMNNPGLTPDDVCRTASGPCTAAFDMNPAAGGRTLPRLNLGTNINRNINNINGGPRGGFGGFGGGYGGNGGRPWP